MLQKGLLGGSIVVAAAATFAPDAFGSYALVLVVLGLVMGFMYPIEDVASRVAIYVLAVLLPGIADAGGDPGRGTPNDGVLLDIPYLGPFVHGFLGNLATVIAGVAIASFILVLCTGLMAAGNDSDDGDDSGNDDSDDGDDEAESAEPEAPSWGGDDSGDDDSDGGDDEAESAEPEAPSWGGDNSGDDDSDDGDDEAEDTRNV